MSRRPKDEDEDESEVIEGGDLKAAMKQLKKKSMKFAFGVTDGRTPVLLLHKTKSPQALANQLKKEMGALKATHGTASSDGEALVLDVEGSKMPGMGKLVKTLLRKEKISGFTEARVRSGGVEQPDEDEDEELPGGRAADDPLEEELLQLKSELLAKERQVGGILKRMKAPQSGDQAALVGYGQMLVEFAKKARETSNPEHVAYGKSCVERAKKMSALAKGYPTDAAAGAPPPPGGASTTYSGEVASGQFEDGGEYSVLAGELEDGPGGLKGKGTVYAQKNADGSEVKILSGEFDDQELGFSASGVVAQAKDGGTTYTLGSAEYKKGFVQDGDKWFAGYKASGAVGKIEEDFTQDFDLPDNAVLKADIGAFSASDEASITDEGLSVGSQANIIEGSITAGTKDANSDTDETMRVGLSLGEGAAGRVHWGDADKDGNREYGAGFDFEFISVDVKTEDPLRTAMKLGAQDPLSRAAREFLPEENLTKKAMDAAAGAGEAVRDLGAQAGEAYDQAAAAAQDLASRTSEGVSSAAAEASDLADRAAQGISDFFSGDDKS